MYLLLFAIFGVTVGTLAAFLGVGGGVIIVPALLLSGVSAQQAVAISAFSIILTSGSATLKNWKSGSMQLSAVLYICIPSLMAAPLGSMLATIISEKLLLFLFSGFLVLILVTMDARARLAKTETDGPSSEYSEPLPAQIFTGALTGFCSGLFGIGGGVILVPLQLLLLKRDLKTAIRYSLSIIVPTASISAVSHALLGNLVLDIGLAIGIGGVIGAQLGAGLLQKGPERAARLGFQAIIVLALITSLSKAFG